MFGKTVPDISLNAVANLGYADCRFSRPVFSGDTLSALSEVIGLKENSNKQSGVVYVRSKGFNQRGETVIEYVRWVMVRKRDPGAAAPEAYVPKLPEAVDAVRARRSLSSNRPRRFRRSSSAVRPTGSRTIPPAKKSTMLTALRSRRPSTRRRPGSIRTPPRCISTSSARGGALRRRLVYGGHVISLARALSFNGLANAFHIAAINGGRHVAPLFAGDTAFAWSEVVETAALPGRDDVGALRLRTVATKNRPCVDFPWHEGEGYEPHVVLELDYWALAPRRP